MCWFPDGTCWIVLDWSELLVHRQVPRSPVPWLTMADWFFRCFDLLLWIWILLAEIAIASGRRWTVRRSLQDRVSFHVISSVFINRICMYLLFPPARWESLDFEKDPSSSPPSPSICSARSGCPELWIASAGGRGVGLDPNSCQRECQTECPIERCQTGCHVECQDRSQKECQNRSHIECQNRRSE